MDRKMNNIFDIIFIACGVYLFYAAFKMKQTGSLEGSILVNKNIDLKKAKDIPGYIGYMFPISLVAACVIVLSGGIGIFNAYVGGIDLLQYVFMGITLIVLIIYGVFSFRAAKKFL